MSFLLKFSAAVMALVSVAGLFLEHDAFILVAVIGALLSAWTVIRIRREDGLRSATGFVVLLFLSGGIALFYAGYLRPTRTARLYEACRNRTGSSPLPFGPLSSPEVATEAFHQDPNAAALLIERFRAGEGEECAAAFGLLVDHGGAATDVVVKAVVDQTLDPRRRTLAATFFLYRADRKALNAIMTIPQEGQDPEVLHRLDILLICLTQSEVLVSMACQDGVLALQGESSGMFYEDLRRRRRFDLADAKEWVAEHKEELGPQHAW